MAQWPLHLQPPLEPQWLLLEEKPPLEVQQPLQANSRWMCLQRPLEMEQPLEAQSMTTSRQNGQRSG